eukprot:6777431-Alexandrium_andersonii.AAC.1
MGAAGVAINELKGKLFAASDEDAWEPSGDAQALMNAVRTGLTSCAKSFAQADSDGALPQVKEMDDLSTALIQKVLDGLECCACACKCS